VTTSLADALLPRSLWSFLRWMLCRHCYWKLVSSSLGGCFATTIKLLCRLPLCWCLFCHRFSLLGCWGWGSFPFCFSFGLIVFLGLLW
jgi:hypothetical protein